MKHSLALFSALAVIASGLLTSTASAEFIYRGPQHHDHHQRYWMEERVHHHHHHRYIVPAHWVWIP